MMGLKAIERWAFVLQFAIIGMIFVWWHSTRALLAGIVYLMAANILCIPCIGLTVRLRNLSTVTYRIRSYARLTIAWQLFILGTLNIGTHVQVELRISMIAFYLLMVGYVVGCYKLLSIADSVEQSGSYMPLTFGGVNRSRRFFFVSFNLIGIIPSLVIASLVISVGSGGWRPTVLQAPQACLLMIAISAAMTAGLLYQRYGGAETHKINGSIVLAMTLCVLAFSAVFEVLLSYGIYMYVLSSIVVTGAAVAIWCLWQIEDRADDSSRSVDVSGQASLLS